MSDLTPDAGNFGARLVEAYSARLSAYVRLRVSAQEAEDLVSEIFLAALAQRQQLRGDLGAWLFGIARNKIAEFYRSQQRDEHVKDSISDTRPQVTAAPSASLAQLEPEEFRVRLQQSMHTLSEIEREVIALKFSQCLDNQQIAKLLKITPNHLGVVLHRALKRLKEEMS